jgi:hypothetical protein
MKHSQLQEKISTFGKKEDMSPKHSRSINKIGMKLKSSSVPDPNKSPFFMKQVEKAKETLRKYPIPVELLVSK